MSNPNPTFGGTPHRRILPTNCKDCNTEMNEDNRAWKVKGVSFHNRCRDCWNKHQNEYQSERRRDSKVFKDKRVHSGWEYTLKSKYGLTEEQYIEMFNSQGGVCAICKFPCVSGDKLCVDHNHTTGEVRGLLCRSCNLAVAAVGESEVLIYSLLYYIQQHNEKVQVPIRPSLKSKET
jgi:hypothetical protein